ncbi:membrane-bound metal-dependent hydrolase [Halorubrum coriense DSM 10284]|uniref:Membrane-bound metal-dependent hydrolase n=1 Tax=Halorubrum coriense DSM 10284 TaxID=1227466 RepID=M0EGQ4_9EURY|nr:membrane-bound metal-dependent hydrolase [Halorubrum coriense DSM 10284]
MVVGTLLPDLVDKPLAVAVGGPFASGRTVAHSLLFAIPAILVFGSVLRRCRGPAVPVVLFAVGYVSHPFLDASVFLLQGTLARDLVEVGFVLWPVGLPADGIFQLLEQLPAIDRAIEAKPRWTARHVPSGARLSRYIRVVELALASAATVLWLADDAPGAEALRDR